MGWSGAECHYLDILQRSRISVGLIDVPGHWLNNLQKKKNNIFYVFKELITQVPM